MDTIIDWSVHGSRPESSEQCANITHMSINRGFHHIPQDQGNAAASASGSHIADPTGSTSDYTARWVADQSAIKGDGYNESGIIRVSEDPTSFGSFSGIPSFAEYVQGLTPQRVELKSAGLTYTYSAFLRDPNNMLGADGCEVGSSAVSDFMNGRLDNSLDALDTSGPPEDSEQAQALIRSQIPTRVSTVRDPHDPIMADRTERLNLHVTATAHLFPTSSQSECDFVARMLEHTASEDVNSANAHTSRSRHDPITPERAEHPATHVPPAVPRLPTPVLSQSECEYIARVLAATASDNPYFREAGAIHPAWLQPVGLPYVRHIPALNLDISASAGPSAHNLAPTRPGTPVASGGDEGSDELIVVLADPSRHHVSASSTLKTRGSASLSSFFGSWVHSSQPSAL